MRKVAIALVSLLFISGIVSAPANAAGTPGQSDSAFNANMSAFNGDVREIVAIQGGFLLGGNFTELIKMIKSDGTSGGEAAVFNSNFAQNRLALGLSDSEVVDNILVLSTGRILISGDFNGIRMLNADGTVIGPPATFNDAVSTSVNRRANAIGEFLNGSIVFGGSGFLKMANADGTGNENAGTFNENVNYINESSIRQILALPDGALFVRFANRDSESNREYGFLGKINPDGTSDGESDSGIIEGSFNLNAASSYYQLFPHGAYLTDAARLPDGSLLLSGGAYTTDGNVAGFIRKLNSDGTLLGPADDFNENISIFSLDNIANQVALPRDDFFLAVGAFSGHVKRFNADGTQSGDSEIFNQSASAVLQGVAAAAAFANDGSLVVVGRVGDTFSGYVHKFYWGGLSPVSSEGESAPQNTSQPSPPQAIPNPIPSQTIPSVKPVPAHGLSVLFSSGSKDLVTRYQKNLKIMVKKSSLQAKYTVSASASMVRGLPRSSVARLAGARAAKVKSYLMTLGVRSANITTKAVVNKIGQPLFTKITVE